MSLSGDKQEIMIAVTDLREFVPFGREQSSRHPVPPGLELRSLQARVLAYPVDHESSLAGFLHHATLLESPEEEAWEVRKVVQPNGEPHEEELYSSGKVVTWSRGTYPFSSVYKSFTVDHPVKKTLWCDFRDWNDDEKVLKSVCIVQRDLINVHTSDGQDFIVPVPFQVFNVWTVKYGLLLERAIMSSEIPNLSMPYPTLFSLLHPLDEIAPVLTSSTGRGTLPSVRYMAEQNQVVVFTSTEPSLVMTYDREHSVHIIWTLRRVQPQERSSVLGPADPSITLPFAVGASGLGVSSSSSILYSPCPELPVFCTPFPNKSAPVMSPSGPAFTGAMLSRTRSPSHSNMASSGRSQSPASSNASYGLRVGSPSPSAIYHRNCHISFNVSANEHEVEAKPVPPELCLEQLWTEKLNTGRKCNRQARKVFLTTDVCNRKFLCFFIESMNELWCVRLEESNDQSLIIFGAVTCLTAQDAAPLEAINMMLLLEPNGSFLLYSGIFKVSKVYLPNTALPMFIKGVAPPQPGPPKESISTPMRPLHTPSLDEMAFISPFQEQHIPTLSSDLTDMEECGFTLPDISPVHHLRDAIGANVTVVLSAGILLRVTLPEMASCPLVNKCLQALRHVLPLDVALNVQARWYVSRNALGRPASPSEWTTFVGCLLGLLGWSTEHTPWARMDDADRSTSPVFAPKKPRPSESGSDEDWESLLSSSYHQSFSSNRMGSFLGLEDAKEPGVSPDTRSEQQCQLATEVPCFRRPLPPISTTPLYTCLPTILLALHVVYEDAKLDTALAEKGHTLGTLLYYLTRRLKLEAYCQHYLCDQPCLVETFKHVPAPNEGPTTGALQGGILPKHPPSILRWLCHCLHGFPPGPFPYIPKVCKRTRIIILTYVLYIRAVTEQKLDSSKYLSRIPAGQGWPPFETGCSGVNPKRAQAESTKNSSFKSKHVLIHFLVKQGFTSKDLATLPFGVALPLWETLYRSRPFASINWPRDASELVGREDLAQQAHRAMVTEKLQSPEKGINEKILSMLRRATEGTASAMISSDDEEEEGEDGMAELVRAVEPSMLWSTDLRLLEVRRLLQSSRPVRLGVVQVLDISDHEFVEVKEARLLQLCQRTMALPVGRGMFTLFSHHPVPTEPLPMPELNLTGRAPPRNATVDLSTGNMELPADMKYWPLFHNGVAAGLRIAPASCVNSAWIIYNRPQGTEMTEEYAGLLMALGLSGHLCALPTMYIHDFLCKNHNIVSVGLLLGIAAAHLGSMDMSATRLLAVHWPALLPPSNSELEVSHNVQVAAVVGVGLVYQGTAHRHITETLLREIGLPPGPEMQNCTDREAYSLAAGLALGMVCLGHGSNLVGMSDLNVPDQLFQYMVGGQKRRQGGAGKERHKSPSYQIKEGKSINVDVTCPGATMALAMIYLKTNNRSIARWMEAPTTQYLLDFVKPDFLLLRILAKGLILWDEIAPTEEWICSNIPEIVKPYGLGLKLDKAVSIAADRDVDLQTMCQAHCHIVAGACLAMGLRFAGSGNALAVKCLHKYTKRFLKVVVNSIDLLDPGRYTLESCLALVLLSLSLVVAGTGQLEVLQLCRFVHRRTEGEVNYGTHMATHMALGFLFLGGGRYSLSTSNSSIAALLCALYPQFPAQSKDNRYHLQALRHLYVLACEPRLLIPVNVDTGVPCYAPVAVTYKATTSSDEDTLVMQAPALLPEMHLIKEVKIVGPRYWEVILDVSSDPQHLKSILARDGVIYVKLPAGHLSYTEDPKGYLSLLAQTFTHPRPQFQAVKPEAIEAFTTDPTILPFAKHFCQPATRENGEKPKGRENCELFSTILYECVTQEKIEMLPIYLAMDQVVRDLESGRLTDTVGLAQLRLVLDFHECAIRQGQEGSLVHPEYLHLVKSSVDGFLEQWLKDPRAAAAMKSFVLGQPTDGDHYTRTMAFVVFNEIPPVSPLVTESLYDFAQLLLTLRNQGVTIAAALRLTSILLPTAS
uniref:anaphase-promoting complex subunit 1 isoform X2 n=1 Tax=Myxine glutinosa TaxID=7769 RepID=UPI00358F4E60